jgi:hypothetical protein
MFILVAVRAAESKQTRRDPAQGPPDLAMKFRPECMRGYEERTTMKLFKGWWVLSLGLALAGGAASAQVATSPETAAPSGPVSDVVAPNSAAPPVAAEPARALPPAGGPSLLPPGEVYVVLRENGFLPLGPPRQRGVFYVIAVTDRYRDQGRLVIDARDGRIVRFVPAYWAFGAMYGDAPGYPPAARMPPISDWGGPPRPPASVPKMANRAPGVPIPRAAPPRPADDSALAEKPARQPPQQSAAVQVKPADALPQLSAPAVEAKPPQTKPSAEAKPVEAKPVEAKSAEVKSTAAPIQPTQPMPMVQGLE